MSLLIKKIKQNHLQEVIINQEPVELCKILKFENVVLSGGEAKQVISQGMVSINGIVETRKRKKIFAGDIVEFNGIKMIMYLNDSKKIL